MGNLKDGIASYDLTLRGTGSISLLVPGSLAVGTYVIDDAGVTTAKMASGAVTSVICGSGAVAYRTGSPSSLPAGVIEQGSGTLSAGSVVWKVFGTAFSASPVVFTTNTKTLGAVTVGSVVAGSFYAFGTTASDTFNWVAIGTR